MSNEYKNFTISFNCNEAFYRALILLLRHCKYMGNVGMSRTVSIYFDGDGADRIKDLVISEEVKESKIGRKSDGEFFLDTDQVFRFIPEE